MMKYLLTLVFCLLLLSLHAQKMGNNTDFIKFFEGTWVGEGQFSNGKKIEAVANFKLSLDSCWITYSHEDKPPNRYKAVSMWAVDKSSGKFLAYIFDNFQGHRLFISNGWKTDSLVLVNKDIGITKAIFFQRFTYTKSNANHFKMTYEVSKDSVTWKLGDSLIFVRQQN